MKVYFCTTAPSSKYRSWSNIPYLLHQNLKQRGYIVENIVIKEIEPIKTIFNLPVRALKKLFKVKTEYYYVRTPVHFFMANVYCKWISLTSSKKDIMLVQGFSYPLHNRKNRQIIIGDWPSEYLFETFLRRTPNRLERNSINRENAVIEGADAIVTLFPSVRDYMLKKYKNKNIYSFGNVINIDETVILPANIRERKHSSRRFLFIGQPFYIAGALELINAANNIREKGYECEVDIVGIEPSLLGLKYEWLHVYGYLDKENNQDKQRYYELLSNAKYYVNTTPGWCGFQALLEAMYFYTPIIVRPNDILKCYFPELDTIAKIIDEDAESLESLLIDSLTNQSSYERMSNAARSSVENSTWKNFTDQLISLFE